MTTHRISWLLLVALLTAPVVAACGFSSTSPTVAGPSSVQPAASPAPGVSPDAPAPAPPGGECVLSADQVSEVTGESFTVTSSRPGRCVFGAGNHEIGVTTDGTEVGLSAWRTTCTSDLAGELVAQTRGEACLVGGGWRGGYVSTGDVRVYLDSFTNGDSMEALYRTLESTTR